MTNTGQLADYCTAWFDWIGDTYIGGCCRVHDYAYENGLPRLEADRALGECVADLGLPLIGQLMVVAVMLFGWLRYKRKR